MGCGYSFEFDLAMIIQCLFFYLLLDYQYKTGARERLEVSEKRACEVTVAAPWVEGRQGGRERVN